MKTAAMRTWFVVFVVLVFLAGAGTGVMVSRRLPGPLAGVLGAPRGLGPGRGFQPAGPPPAALVGRLAADLGLDADQQRRLQAVLEQRRAGLQTFNRDVRERFETEQRDLRAEISRILTPDQQRRFDEWLRRPRRGSWWRDRP